MFFYTSIRTKKVKKEIFMYAIPKDVRKILNIIFCVTCAEFFNFMLFSKSNKVIVYVPVCCLAATLS